MTGHGGWPMTVFLTPDGRPFFGGTYFPNEPAAACRASSEVLPGGRRRVAGPPRRRSTSRPSELTDAHRPSVAARAPRGRRLPGARGRSTRRRRPCWPALRRRVGRLRRRRRSSPRPISLELLLRAYTAHRDARRRSAMVTTTLDAMAAGGIYDHLGGGFARYSVDTRWLVPHFEKMLYDQALLIRAYLHAWQVTGEARYRQVVERRSTTCCATCAIPTAASTRPRTPTPRARRARSTSGRRRAASRCSATTPTRPSSGTASPRRQLRGAPTSSTGRCGATCSAARGRSSGPARCCSTPGSSGCAPGSTTRCSPSGTG